MQILPAILDRRTRPNRATANLQRQRRLTRSEVDNLVDLYATGINVRQLATAFGINRDTALRRLQRRGGVCHRTVIEHLQRAGVHMRKPQRKLVDGRLTQAIEHYSAGLSLARVGQILGVDAKTVGRSLRDAGVEVRPRRGQRG